MNTPSPATKPFPFYYAQRDAVCFKCAAPLLNLRSSGYAPLHGGYVGDCPRCRAEDPDALPLRSWYDCSEGGIGAIAINEFRDARPAEFGAVPRLKRAGEGRGEP